MALLRLRAVAMRARNPPRDAHTTSSRECLLLSLGDELVLRVLAAVEPLSRFAAQAACRRLRELCGDPRLALYVRGCGPEAVEVLSGARAAVTLREALCVALPGDTIRLPAGCHYTDESLRVGAGRPVRVEGCGVGRCKLVSAPGVDTLSTSASLLLRGVAVEATGGGACVRHGGGALTLERCTLRCLPTPLMHLIEAVRSSGCGRVSVSDTRIEGGPRAVRVLGQGRLRNVRFYAGVYAFDVSAEQGRPCGAEGAAERAEMLDTTVLKPVSPLRGQKMVLNPNPY